MSRKKVCIVGPSGKLGQSMMRHALDRGYALVGVCRERSVGKLDAFRRRITVIPGATNDREVIQKAVAGCDGVLTVLVPWGVQEYASGTAQAGSTSRVRTRASSSPVADTFRATDKIFIHGLS
jgi:putative NADH-flavin reductase